MKRILLLLALACVSCSELFETKSPPGYITVRFSNLQPSLAGETSPLAAGAGVSPGIGATNASGASTGPTAGVEQAGSGAPSGAGAGLAALATAPFAVATSLPDVGEFILTLADSGGEVIYKGPYADSPEYFEVPAGNYTVSAVSCEFGEPQYSSPQWGDTQVVCVAAGATVAALLTCGQVNSGLKIGVSAEFRTLFPQATLYMESADGRLMYAYGESRVAYFNPGNVRVSMSNAGEEQTLFTRNLAARQVLAITLTASRKRDDGTGGSGGDDGSGGDGGVSGSGGSGMSGISIQVDTVRNWTEESIQFGDGEPGEILDVPSAREAGARGDVWVYGYIVGSFSANNHCEFEPPFSKSTNIVIAARTGVTDKSLCVSVELKAGPIRESLNLQDHPDLRGRKVYLHGDLVEAYYGLPGLKNVSDFRLN